MRGHVRGGSDERRARTHFFETLSTGDLERVRPLFHEDATWRSWPAAFRRRDARRARRDRRRVPGAGTRDVRSGDPKVVIDNLIAEGSLVAVEARGQGRFADGREYNNRYAFVLELEGGLIRSLREYLDSFYISTLVLTVSFSFGLGGASPKSASTRRQRPRSRTNRAQTRARAGLGGARSAETSGHRARRAPVPVEVVARS